MSNLLKSVRTSALCVADLSGNNRNVLWELGYAMALAKPVIIITQKRDEIGFDLRNFRNIEYKRDDLKSSLGQQLVKEIEDVFTEPACYSCPTDPHHAQVLAMSTASPTYFLDAEFRIKYMNEAAVDFFLANRAEGASYWYDMTLRDFINRFADRLVNATDIERNLQVQSESIQELVEAGKPEAVQSYNIEPVVLRTAKYGTITLQKTGVAVRDAIDGRITGWVVTFNVVKPEDQGRFEKFHSDHRRAIETFPFKLPAAAKGTRGAFMQRDYLPSDEEIQSFLQENGPIAISEAQNYAEQQQCFEFAAYVMRSDIRRYGLESVSHLRDHFFDYRNTVFFMVRGARHIDDGSRKLFAVFRLSKNHDLKQYTNLGPSVRALMQAGNKFADAGVYVLPKLRPKRAEIVSTLLGHAAACCRLSLSTDYIYAQVPMELLSRYVRMYAWEQAGAEFTESGWQQTWVPILLKCSVYSKSGGDCAPASDMGFINRAREAYAEYENSLRQFPD